MTESGLRFLEKDPTRDQLLRAVASNHLWWMIRTARGVGGEVRRENGATWVYTPGQMGEVSIMFPRLARPNASEQLDAIMRYCRRRLPLRHVSCWSLTQPKPRDLGARLVARGFEWGWRPHWMWLDLRKMRTRHPKPRGLSVEIVEDEAIWDVDDLPYYSQDAAAYLHAASSLRPRRLWHFAAWLDGRLVGHIVLNLTTGRLGVAGIFSCGVIPEARNKGIGKAITLAACRFAQGMGCRHALLNATPMGEPVYLRIGFESIGYGQTWWLGGKVLESKPPTRAQIAFIEAVGRGDVGALDSLAKRIKPEVLDAPLPGGMRPLDLAVKMSKPASAEWLIEHGVGLDVLSAWDLGWKDRVRRMLAESPDLASARLGGGQITPLHEAAFRGDAELARVLLAADPDLDVRDREFDSTPLGWAKHFKRREIVRMIERHRDRAKSIKSNSLKT